jgi:hypothetical protein
MPGGSICSIGTENSRPRGWRACVCQWVAALCWHGGILRLRPAWKLALTLWLVPRGTTMTDRLYQELPRARRRRLIFRAVLRGVLGAAVLVVLYYVLPLDEPWNGDTAVSFTQPLTRTDALYFSVTAFSTVGFGDITARSEAARVVLIVQMLGDLALLGAGARVLLEAVSRGRQRRSDTGDDG